MVEERSHEVTRLLGRLEAGDAQAVDELVPHVYSELRKIATSFLRKERPDHTLQPTALVNEAYIRLVGQRNTRWEGKSHFVAVAAQAMRRILVDYARRRAARKRDGGAVLQLEDSVFTDAPQPLDVLVVNDALTRLALLDARQARIVELRFFGGLSVEETALALGVSEATVKREWRIARAWLKRELSEHE